MRILVGTNVISEAMKRSPVLSVVNWLEKLERVPLSVVSVEEIYCGLSHKDTRRQLEWFEKFLRCRGNILPVTAEIARKAGNLRGGLLRRGHVHTQADILIAATANHHNLVLATRNRKDFESCGVELLNPFSL